MSKYFAPKEYECPCGCGLRRMAPAFLIKLDRVRKTVGMPLMLNSGCRCESHNIAIGGALYSPHMLLEDGWTHAGDIRCDNSKLRSLILKAAYLQGINRVGIGRGFIHIDDADSLNNGIHESEVAWHYYGKGRQ